MGKSRLNKKQQIVSTHYITVYIYSILFKHTLLLVTVVYIVTKLLLRHQGSLPLISINSHGRLP